MSSGESEARSTSSIWWHAPAAFCGRLILRTLWSTYRYHIVSMPGDELDEIGSIAPNAPNAPTIHLCWHDQTALCGPYFIRRVHDPQNPLALMTSQSRDGELVTRCLRPFGLEIVRGSATRGGREALRALYRVVRKRHASPLILPDGPQGPLHVVKPGAIVLSQMTGAPIVPYGFATRRAWTLGSWDRMRVAKPGAAIAVVSGPPIVVPRALEDSERDDLCESVGRSLRRLTRAAADRLPE